MYCFFWNLKSLLNKSPAAYLEAPDINGACQFAYTEWSKSRWTVKNFYLKITRLLTKDKIKDQIE